MCVSTDAPAFASILSTRRNVARERRLRRIYKDDEFAGAGASIGRGMKEGTRTGDTHVRVVPFFFSRFSSVLFRSRFC